MKPFIRIAIIFLLVQCLYSFDNTKASVITDSIFSFEIEIPEEWNTQKAKNDSSYCRLVSHSSDKSISLYIYSGRIVKGFINLNNVVDIGKKSFPFLGNEYKRNKVGANRYEVYYDNDNQNAAFAKVIYLAKENNYYILISYSKFQDLSPADTLLNTFQSKVQFSWFTILFVIGTISLLFHVIIFHYFAIQFLRNNTLDSFKQSFILNWNFLWSVPVFLFISYFIFYKVDYLVIGNIFSSYKLFGTEGVVYQLIEIGPNFYVLCGEILADFMSEIIGFGYWPGGRTGVIFSTVVSIVLNGIEIFYAIKLKSKEFVVD